MEILWDLTINVKQSDNILCKKTFLHLLTKNAKDFALSEKHIEEWNVKFLRDVTEQN